MEIPIILLVIDDVPEKQRKVLSHYFKIVSINFIKCNPKHIKTYRFKDVFTKLQIFKLDKYDKIIMLDTDMLLLKNIDHLFKMRPPAASSSRITIKHNKIIPKEMIVKDGKIVGRINAGLMVLKPEKKVFDFMVNDILENKQLDMKHEQDYLSWYYA